MNKSVLKSIGAVFAGIAAIVALSVVTDAVLEAAGIMPGPDQPQSDAALSLATLYRTLYGVIGGYLTARLAPAKPLQHAIVLGVIGIGLGTLGAVVTRNMPAVRGHEWYPIALVVLALPQCWLGGWLRARRS